MTDPVKETSGVEEKHTQPAYDGRLSPAFATDEVHVEIENELTITGDDLADAEESAKDLSLEDVRSVLKDVIQIHESDQNFPVHVLDQMKEFIDNQDILNNPEHHEKLILEMKVEAALIANNSPYPEVRAVVDNTDDATMPCSTVRAWVLGTLFVIAGIFINQLFLIRQPTITIEANVAQLLAYPVGKAWELWMPAWKFSIFGRQHNLNPGRFNKKEHMLITIMANVGFNTPYTNDIIWTQYLPQYFNQIYAGNFGYQILIGLGTNFIGYGIAGLCRQFLVYPAHCVWPASLVTIALNQSFHMESNVPAPGPFKRVFTASRMKCFLIFFGSMFLYFWFPNYIFQALSIFNWMCWIAPNSINLSAITGMVNGIGLNPIPTLDWNTLLFDQGHSPLVLPFFFWWNAFVGMSISAFLIVGIWYSNIFHTAYLPMNSNRVFDHFGDLYNVSRAIDSRGIFDPVKYEQYSPAYLSAGYACLYLFFFAIYTATISYTYLYHRHEIWTGIRKLFRRSGESVVFQDVHNRLMSKYPEVSEWWYLAILLAAIACSIGAISGWQTFTTPAVVLYGIALCLLFVVPVGLINAITGMEITLNVLAEFIGGSFVAGNALAMNYFKSFGYVTCSQALHFSNDLKMAHYVKLPPWHTFSAQLVATLVSTFVATGVLNFQMNRISTVCTVTQKDHYTCPGINQFFTAAVLWGTIGPKKVFGAGGQYTWLLFGFPLGFLLPIVLFFVRKALPKQKWLRNFHPVVIFYGGQYWAPYNLGYLWPSVPISWLSHVYFKKRYTALWSKYNYVISASFSAAIAIAAIVIFFALQMPSVSLDWWGNTVYSEGCEGTACTFMTLADGEYFGPRIGQFH